MSHPNVAASWRKDEIPLGQWGNVVAFSRDGWTAIAGLGMVLLSPPDGRSWKPLKGGKGGFRLTMDGGSTYHTVDQLGKRLPDSVNIKTLCSPESAVLTPSGRLYIKAICDHITQLWSIPTRNESEDWNVVAFTYETDPSNGVYSAGHNLTLIDGRVLIETNLPGGSALLTTDNNGATWYPWWQGSAEHAGIVGLSFIDERRGWMLEGDGHLFKTLDGGRRWDSLAQLPSELAGKFHSLQFADPQTGFIAGGGGLFFVSRDGGRSWERKTVPSTEDLYKLAAANANQVWAIGNNGTVLETTDGGEHWSKVPLGLEKDLRTGLTVKQGVAWLVLDRFLFRSS